MKIRNIHRIEGRQTQQTTAHQLFRFDISVSKLAGGSVVDHLIEVGKRGHQQRSLMNVAAPRFRVMLSPGLPGMFITVEDHPDLPVSWTEESDIGVIEGESPTRG